jgi:aspartyl-tRNA(Asn)/glutamyl-tRNA(Gln) amidotransferase subunit A
LPRTRRAPANLHFLSIAELAPLVRACRVSPVELTEAMLERIARLNPSLNAYLTVCADEARAAAARAAREIAARRCRGPLHGIPLALKDNIWTRGIRTTAGSAVLRDFVPDADATVVERLRRAGAVLLGKTNLHEFAYGVTTNNPHFGPTRNPWDRERIPGGSSGGNAAALAAGLCYGSVGSDTGGSIRIPAALCGIAGIKPTFGRVSCFGVIPLSPSLDHTGPLARTVEDLAILLRVLAGRDPRDESTVRAAVPDYAREARRPLGKVKLGWPRNFFFERADEEIVRLMEAAARQFERLGTRMEEVSLPHVGESGDAGTQIAVAEARLVHEQAGWYPARAEQYSEEVRKRLEWGAEIRATDYLHALASRQAVRADFDAAFARVDAILAPCTPIAAPRIGEKNVRLGGQDEDVRAALLRMNRPSNFTGLPALSVPCGFTRAGLPVGLQLIGRAFEEGRLLRIARAYEQATRWHLRRPPEV